MDSDNRVSNAVGSRDDDVVVISDVPFTRAAQSGEWDLKLSAFSNGTNLLMKLRIIVSKN